MTAPDSVFLVTGFPSSPLATRLMRSLLEAHPSCSVRCIVPRAETARATMLVSALAPRDKERVTLLSGEPWGLDFGLSGDEWKSLARDVDVIHHASQSTQVGLDRAEAMRVNRGSTIEALELAQAAKHLDRLVLWSSASVSGTRTGFILEDELDTSYPTRNPVEESLRRSEELARRLVGELPLTVLRPGIVVGDSKSGEVDRMEGIALLILLMLNAAPDRPMPLPVRSGIPLSIVPIDHVVRAGRHIAADPRSRGRTFHIVDSDPLTAERVFELLARSVGRKIPKTFLPPFIASRLMRLPGIQPGGSQPLPHSFLDQIGTEVVYDDGGAKMILAGTGITCPAFESFVDVMVRYVREHELGAPRTYDGASV